MLHEITAIDLTIFHVIVPFYYVIRDIIFECCHLTKHRHDFFSFEIQYFEQYKSIFKEIDDLEIWTSFT